MIAASRTKKPKRMSWVLNLEVLEEVIVSEGLTSEVQVAFSEFDCVFECLLFESLKENGGHRFYIRTGAFEGSFVKDMKAALKETVLPQWVSWAKAIESLPANSTELNKEQHFYASLGENGKVYTCAT